MLIKFNNNIAWECERPTLSGLEYQYYKYVWKQLLDLIVLSWQAALPLAHGQFCSSTFCIQRRVAEFCGHMVHSSAYLSISVSASLFLCPKLFFLCLSLFWLNLLHSLSMQVWRTHTHTHLHTLTHTNNIVRFIIIDSRISIAFESNQTNTK